MKIRSPLAAAALVLLGSTQAAEATAMTQIAVELYGWHVVALALVIGVVIAAVSTRYRSRRRP